MASITCAVALVILLGVAGIEAKFSRFIQDRKFAVLEKWVQDNGGTIKARVGLSDKGLRGLYATQPISEGDPIVSIPASTIINVGSSKGSFLTPSLMVLREKLNPYSRFKPYLDAIPDLGEALNACNLDEKLWPMFESQYWTDFVFSWQNFLNKSLNGEVNSELEVTIPEVLGNVTGRLNLHQLKNACALTATRYVEVSERGRLLMVPFFDMTNHHRHCPNYLADYTGDMIDFIAGHNISANEEICNTYGSTVRDDFCFVHYGFVPELDSPPRLMLIDHHQFSPHYHQQYITEEVFDSPYGEVIDAEIARLKAIQSELQKRDTETQTRPPRGADPRSDMLLELQFRRRAAIRAELERLTAMRSKAEL